MQKVWSIISRRLRIAARTVQALSGFGGVRLAARGALKKIRGFSVVEVLLAATLFGFLVVALSGAIIYGRAGTATAGDRLQALALAEEGLEAVRNIRDASFSNLSDGTFGLATGGSPLQWNFSGSSDTTGIFTRQITISTVDSVRKAVTATVSWTTNGDSRSVSATTRLNDWRAAFPITSGPIMMAYSKSTDTPFYRTWDGSAWSAEGSASTVTGAVNYVVLKSARTRNEAILGVQTATGAIFVQVWNGTTWGSATQVGTGPTTTRSFDIAYEKNGDRAIIAYADSSTPGDMSYRIWNGTTLSSATDYTTMPLLGAINWIELRQNPLSSSNEIAFIALDANSDVYGMAWNGIGWSNLGTALVWDSTAATAARKAIDVEYEQNSGHILFIWGDATSTDNYYRTWNGTTLSAATLLDVSTMGGVANWVQLAARPASDEILFGVQDAGGDLNTRKWSGTAWDTVTQHPEHDATVENVASRNFDIVWETHPSNPGVAWMLWGDQATVTQRRWSGTAWATAGAISGTDDTSFVRLRADPVSGAVLAGIYQNAGSAGNARDISSRQLTGGGSTWSAKNIIWGGPTAFDPVYFRIDIALP